MSIQFLERKRRTCVLTDVTAVPVIPGALVEVPAGVVVRCELVAVATLALVASLAVKAGLVTASLAGLRALVYINTLEALLVNTLVTRPASEERHNGRDRDSLIRESV